MIILHNCSSRNKKVHKQVSKSRQEDGNQRFSNLILWSRTNTKNSMPRCLRFICNNWELLTNHLIWKCTLSNIWLAKNSHISCIFHIKQWIYFLFLMKLLDIIKKKKKPKQGITKQFQLLLFVVLIHSHLILVIFLVQHSNKSIWQLHTAILEKVKATIK